jgi:serine/threonine protein phosphatase PrpC
MIADGIGGHNTGEIASEMAKKMIPDRLTISPPSASEITRRLKAALEEAGQAIYDASLADPNRSGMGTTCTAIVVADRRLYLAHVGDSRAYLLRNGQLCQLTIDHTWAEEAIRAGRSPDEIRTHPNRGVIMRYLGIDPIVNVDTRYRGVASEIVDALEAGPLFLEPGDTLMLCSDGVSDPLDARLLADYMAYPDCQTAAVALVSNALKAGATDNVTALVLRLPGGIVAPPAALAPAGKKLSVLPLALAALGLVALGVVLALALSGRGRSQPTPVPSAAVSIAPTAIQVAITTPRPEGTGSVVQVATHTRSPTHAPSPAVTLAAVTSPTMPVVDATLTVTGTGAIIGTATITGASPVPGEPTIVPTFTVAPTRTPVPPTARPTPERATATSRPSTTGGVDLLSPAEDERIAGSAIFKWEDQPGFKLVSGQQYELIVWGLDGDPMRDGRSPVGGTVQTVAQADLEGTEGALGIAAGQSYYWGVRLISSNGTKIRMLSDGRKFVYEHSAAPARQPTAECSGSLCP